MRDLVLYMHIIAGILIIVLSIFILRNIQAKPKWLKQASLLTAAISWIMIVPSGILYRVFYPATKTLIKAGTWPWAHSIVMETKEHWGLLIPVIATVAAGLVYSGRLKESKKWWILLIVVALLIGVMGRTVVLGGMKG